MSVPNFTTLDQVFSHLNVTGNSSGTSVVFGLPILNITAQAHVDHANKYVYSIVPTLSDPSDPRYVSAQLAALDIACLGVLVAIIGGSLVGAYNYSLGDMHVSRAGPYATAIKMAIDVYHQNAASNLQNVSSVAKSANSTRHIPRYAGPELSP